MHRSAGELDPRRQGRLVDLQAVKAGAAEGRDQGRMDVEDLIGVGFGDPFVQNHHKARQDDQVGLFLVQRVQDGLGVAFPVGIGLTLHHPVGNPGLLGPFQGKNAGLGGDDAGDFPAGDLPPLFRVDEGLQVGAAAGHQDHDIFHGNPPLIPK